MAYSEDLEGMLIDHWFFKYEATDDVVSLPENFLCDTCGQHVSRHAYISPPQTSGWVDVVEEDED